MVDDAALYFDILNSIIMIYLFLNEFILYVFIFLFYFMYYSHEFPRVHIPKKMWFHIF